MLGKLVNAQYMLAIIICNLDSFLTACILFMLSLFTDESVTFYCIPTEISCFSPSLYGNWISALLKGYKVQS